MRYTLAIADRTYSSWSLRGWLLFEKFGLPVTISTARLYTDAFPEMLEAFDMAQRVPALRIEEEGNTFCVWDTLAITETLAERHPEAGIWPGDPAARAMARSLVAEIHAGFTALRGECDMNLRHAYDGFAPSGEVVRDAQRIEELWTEARRHHGSSGPWLFGEFSAADAFYIPVATRFATYQLKLGTVAADYMQTVLTDTSFRRWRAMGLAERHLQPVYELDLPSKPWPGPALLEAEPVAGVVPVNQTCPYSGKPVSDAALARICGQVIGFCNPFCRDKTVADPEAWPAAMALIV